MIVLLAACTPDPVGLDDLLSLSHAQVVGTHNSYHLSGDGDFGPWEYDHRPLDQQIDIGVRQFELDLHWIDDDWQVIHEPAFDPGTTCPLLSECLAALRVGSERNPEHLPIVILLEIKESFDADTAEERLQVLASHLGRELGVDDLLAPATIQGPAPTMRDAMLAGWPVLQGQRGRFIPVIHEGGGWSSTGRALGMDHVFYDAFGDLDADWAAVHTSNDPFDAEVGRVASAGHLVRTRADSNTLQARENDPSTAEQAFASGAHFVSTDFPEPHPITGYQVSIGATVARCNPLTAIDACSADLLESVPSD